MALNLLDLGQFLRTIMGGHISLTATLKRLCGGPHNRLSAGTDLFGVWLVEITFGRIGSPGRRLRYAAGNEAEARKLVQKSLRRRATAPRRIGVLYHLRELIDPWQWMA